MKPLLLSAAFILMASSAFAQDQSAYEFLSPMPSSIENSRQSTIIIREGSQINPGTLDVSAIRVTGSLSGHVSVATTLSSDGKTIIAKPDHVFAPGEIVDVVVQGDVRTLAGKALPPADFSFRISSLERMPDPYDLMPVLRPPVKTDAGTIDGQSFTSRVDDFPVMDIQIYDSTAIGEGYLFLAVASNVEGVGYYLMMLNNDGTPFFSRALADDYAYDFKMQPNGMLSYAHFFEHHSYTGGGNVVHKILNSSLALVDSVQMGNGYVAEAHDFQMLPNGHYLLFGYYLTPVDMSQIVAGGQPDALVSGGVVQELDAQKNVIFQWRSWDHYDFEDWSYNSRFATRSIVSTFHLNTINLDDDGHILLATPQWTRKINRQTGDVIWTLGGPHNEFSFADVDSTEGVGMVGGHAIHRLPNGNMLMYDNGNRQGTRTSQAHEFAIDESGRVVDFVWSYVPDSLVAGWHRGNAQRLPNGNTVIGWGGSSGLPSPAVTEVNAAGEKVYELSFVPPDVESYRAFRFPFTGGAPSASVVIIEVVPGNTYDFVDTGGDTGVSVTLNTIDSFGYNELAVTRFDFAPKAPEFFGKAPRVQPARMVLDNFAIDAIDADIRFDVAAWDIADPENTIVYHREFEGQGLFLPLPTTYNPVKGQVVGSTTQFGEYILATADFSSVVFTPRPYFPADGDSVNQDLPVTLQWSSIGYVTSFDMQVATDESFTSTVVDVTSMREALFEMASVAAAVEYYWRVRSTNDAGTSEWSAAQRFATVEPFIELIAPNGAAELQRGLDHYIRWTDNIEEDVIIDLLRNAVMVAPVVTTASDGAYLWEVDAQLEMGSGYALRIASSADAELFAQSEQGFVIIDTTATAIEAPAGPVRDFSLHQNYPNPFAPETVMGFAVPEPSGVVIRVFDVLGRQVATVVDGQFAVGVHSALWNGTSSTGERLASGVYLYRMDAGEFTETRQLVMLR
ncbi:MAG: T9SS type A sorting domain-containing protein [Rhodothermales bacterium]|nr:T9SS type A sorting domain-containing protein [Rhodothermales bacterium]